MNCVDVVCKKLGLANNEHFKLCLPSQYQGKGDDTPCNDTIYWFDNRDFHWDKENDPDTHAAAYEKLYLLLVGVATVFRLPWAPEYNDTYYTVSKAGKVEYHINTNCEFDLMCKYLGNCYKTEADATSEIRDWVLWFEEQRGGGGDV